MAQRMRIAWTGLSMAMLASVVALLAWLNTMPTGGPAEVDGAAAGSAAGIGTPLRLGLVPERDIFAQRRRYRDLADYLAKPLGRPIELVTVNTYLGVLEEFEAGRIDAAFVGSMVAVLAHDRLQAHVVCKPRLPGGVSTYRGVIFVRSDSDIQSVTDLAGRSIALVRTTTAGNLYPIALFIELGMLGGPNSPELLWAGTHDEAVMAVACGDVDAGAVKDLRLEALIVANPALQLRRLATGPAAPNNALIVGRNISPTVNRELSAALLSMHETEAGRATLALFGAERFEPCTIDEYAAIYEMVQRLGDNWGQVGVTGPAPARPPGDRTATPED